MLRTALSALSLAIALPLSAAPATAQEPGEETGVFDGVVGGRAGTKTTVTSGQGGPSIDEVQRESYDGPKARIAVARFENKAHGNWYSRRIGDGMADQLATALFSTNRYIVLERQNLGDVIREQDLGASGRVRQNTAAPIGQIEGAELMVVGAVTEFEDNASGSQGSAGGGLSGLLGNRFGSIVGAVTSGVRRAHMAIDVRIIDSRTSRIVAATSVEGEATDVNMGGMLGGRYGGGALVGGLSGWKNTPKEKALRECIKAAVDFIVTKTPAVYMRHGQQRVAAATPAMAATPPAAAMPEPETPAAQTVTRFAPGIVVRVTASKLNMRDTPRNGEVVASLSEGTPLLIEQQDGRWIKVKTRTDLTGWVAAWLTRQDPGYAASNFADATGPDPVLAAPKEADASPAGGGSNVEDIKARLSQLKELHDAGLITDQEYNAKRAAILKEL